MRAKALDCMELVELVTDYLEGVMDHADRSRFEAHLSECDGCAAYVDQIRATITLGGRLREQDVPKPILDSLMIAFREWNAERA